MQLGRLDLRVTLFSRGAGSTDANGQVTPAWVNEGEVWAERINQRSAEAVQAAQIGDDVLLELHIRHRADVLTTWRLELAGTGYDIISVQDFGGRKDRTRLLCRKGIKDGR